MPGDNSFVFVDFTLEHSQREKELRAAQVKSHAARESHRRKAPSACHVKRWEPRRVQRKLRLHDCQNRHEAGLPSAERNDKYHDGGVPHNTWRLSSRDVGEDMMDPFGVLSFLNMPDYAHQVIEYGWFVLK